MDWAVLMPRKSNVSAVIKAAKSVGVELTPKEAQQIVNICVRLGVSFIKKMVKPESVRDLLQAYFKSLEPTGMFAGADKIYDEDKAGQRRGEIKEKKDRGFTRMYFKKQAPNKTG